MFYFDTTGQEWDAIHLYIANNKDWMKLSIEQCKQANNGRLSWYGVSSLVKEALRIGDTNITQREIDLAYGLKYCQTHIFTHTT